MADTTRHSQLNFAPVGGSFSTWVPSAPPMPDVNTNRSNQLQFNLNIAANPTNMVAKFRNPGPLVIEKLGGGGGVDTQNTSPDKVSPLKFSAVSEDR